jgi:hypothetical protein
MKRMILTILVMVTILTGCTSDEKVLEIAKQYVSENIIPLFPNDTVTIIKEKKFHQVDFIKSFMEQQKLVYSMHDAERDELHRRAKLIKSSGNWYSNEKEKRMYDVKMSIDRSSRDAIEKADSKTGFYRVFVQVLFDRQYPHIYPHIYSIIISKDLKVLNELKFED